MDATPFYEQGLAFRGIPDTLATQHLEGSECCLIHADNPLSLTKGVWLNPEVRVGYNNPAYEAVNSNTHWLSLYEIVTWSWKNRFSRWLTTPWFKEQVVRWTLSTWKKEYSKNDEKGVDCLVNEMQVVSNNGWAHL